MHKSLFLSSLAWLVASTTVFAGGVVLYSILPNTADDTNLEYIEITNSSCIPINLAGYSLKDATGTTYTLANESLAPGAIKRYGRPETRIALNNTDEIVYLLDPTGATIDTERYATSVKGVPISFTIAQDVGCATQTTEETTTTTTTTTTTSSSGATASGSSGSGATITPIIVGTGTTNTGALTNTGTLSNIGSTQSGTTQTVGAISSSWSLSTGTGSTTSTGAISGTGSLSASGSTNPTSSTGATSTGSTNTGTLSTNTGSTNSGTMSTSTGTLSLTPPIPLLLKIYDLDANGRVDRLIVDYSATLTGTLRMDRFTLTSATGGLSSRRIDSGSGVVRALSYSGSELWIDLFEQDIVRTDLRINATTESHLRLKILSDFGLTSLAGVAAEPLTLTESFGKYRSEYILNFAIPPVAAPVASQSPVIIQVNTPAALTPNIPIPTVIPPETAVVAKLPEPLPNISINPQSWILPDGTCKTTTCRINLEAQWIVKWDSCTWTTQFASRVVRIPASCNPGAFTLGGDGGVVKLAVTRRTGVVDTHAIRILPYQESVKAPKVPVPVVETLSSVWQEDDSLEVASDIQEVAQAKAPEKSVTKSTSKKTPKTPAKKPPKKTPPKTPKSPASTTKSTTSTTKTTKTTKSANPTGVTEKTPKNGLANTTDTNTSIAIGVVGLLCSGLGFGVALYRKRAPSPLP